jgi:hypothetical protein
MLDVTAGLLRCFSVCATAITHGWGRAGRDRVTLMRSMDVRAGS